MTADIMFGGITSVDKVYTDKRPTLTSDELSDIYTRLKDDCYTDAIAGYEAYSDFKRDCPDAAQYVDNEEVFYSIKNGFHCDEVPARLIWLARKAYASTKCCSAIPSRLPKSEITNLTTLGYLKDGWTLYDVIVTFVDGKFEAMPEDRSWTQSSEGIEFLDRAKNEYYLIPWEVANKFPPQYYKVVDGKFYLNDFVTGDDYF